ncbi:MAG: 5-formyltetrahydrofolate cyclo-ligase [Hyphomicrobiales bacterium]
MRRQLIAARLAVPPEVRAQAADAISERLAPLVEPGQVFSFYWPMKGEMDFRPLAARLHGRGVRMALPVVVEKQQPMVFRPWAPKAEMRRGIWNIPEPVSEETVVPDVTLVPVVGFSEDGYRLGYGGGYFDRTLAVLAPRPLAIGVGLEIQRLETIHPMPHDIRLDAIMTERATFGLPAAGT